MVEPFRWATRTFTTDWGHEVFYVCPKCSAICDTPEGHERWHAEFDKQHKEDMRKAAGNA